MTSETTPARRGQSAADHAELLAEIIDGLNQGCLVFDGSPEEGFPLVFSNDQAISIPELCQRTTRPGVSEETLFHFVARRGDFGQAPERAIERYRRHARLRRTFSVEGRTPSGRHYRVVRRRRANGGSVVFVSDITGERRSRALLERNRQRLEEINIVMRHRAHHDALTGLPNRRDLDEALPRMLARCERSGQRCAVLHLDLDNFKEVNDTFGHLAGDTLLKIVSERLVGRLRKDDLVARVGGDEFVIAGVLTGQESDVQTWAQRLIEALSAPVRLEMGEVTTGASIGVSLGAGASDPEDLLREADAALYRAKQAGRGRVAFFSAELQEQAEQRRKAVERVSAAILRQRLSARYLPRECAETGALAGYTLAPLFDGDRGAWPTPRNRRNDILATGRASDLDAFLIESAADARERMTREGLGGLELIVPLMQSVRMEASVADLIGAIGSGPGGDRFVFALPHEVFAEDARPNMVEVINELSKRGVRLQVDCVGAHFNAYAQLAERPPSVLRIAESVMRRFQAGTDARALIAAVTSAGKVLGIGVTAPCVADLSVIPLLAEMGCRHVEGDAMGPARDLDEAVSRALQPRAAG